MRKRITSLLLMFAMLLSMVPTAYAEDLSSSQTRTIPGKIDDSTIWSYVDDGSVTDTDWNTADYNDSGWKTGVGPFGSAATVTGVPANTVLGGCTGEDNVATYFFRTQFSVEETSDITSLVGALEYDDAAIIYLNGTKIYEGKQNGSVSGFGYAGTDKAAQRAESLVIDDTDALAALKAGVNTVAVEVHNSSATDTDVWFHMNLKASDGKQEQIDEFTVWSWFGAPVSGEHVDPAGDSAAEGYNRLIWTEPTYEEKDWATGVGPFCSQGKGQIYQNVSPVEIAPTLLVGTDRKNNSPAYFFRTELYLTRETLGNLESIEGRLCFDDAVVVYINGAKVYEGANSTKNTPITSNLQYAGGGNPVSKEFSVTDFSNLNLHVGNNTVAVELHQESVSSNDIWLDFEMDTVVGVRTAIDDDSIWAYVNAESLPEEANWTAANYDDSSWNAGKGAFASAATLNSVAANTVLTGFGESKDVNYYFRTQFTVPKGEKANIKSLVGVLEYDDSATIYLNGTEIYEGKENGTDTGTQHAEVLLFDSDEVLGLLQEGTNTVAVAMSDKTQEEHDGWFHLNLAPHDGTQEKLDHTSIWTYLDNDTDPAGTPGTEQYERTSWTKADFDDSTWRKGIAPFGYQNSNKSSVYKNVNPPEVGATELKFKGSDGKNNVHAYFFRTDLYIEDLETVGSLNGWISCDDAAIVYINGVKVFEWTKDAVNGNLEYAYGPAGNPSPTAFKVTDLADLNLKQGSNVVAIKLHQDRADGGDIWLDFTLEPSEERAEHLSNIVMNPGPDETQMYFTWYADVEKAGYVALAKYDTIVDGTMPDDAVKQVATVKEATDGNYNYKVTAQNLEKGVKYAYQVVSGNYKSDVYSFTTGSGETDFSFGFVADIQIVGSNNTKWADSLNKLVTEFPNQSFLLSAGDQINTNSSEVEYDHLLDLEQMRSLPFAPVVGNHDRNKIYQEHFTQPNLSTQYGITPGGADSYFVYNGVLFLLINAHAAGSPAEEHKAFIQQAIEETKDQDIKWKVVCMHSSFYSNVTDNANLGNDRHNLRTTFMPVFQELGIDVVFSGHDHIYARSYMLDGVDRIDTDAVYTYDKNNVPVSVSNSDGVLYVAGSSPGNRCNAMAEKLEWVAVQGVDKRQNISNVTVTDTTFNITTYYTADMSVLDTFTIHKGVEQTDIALNMGADETEMNITWYSNAAGTGTVKLAKRSDLVGNAMPERAKTFSATGVASSQTGYNSYQTTMTGLEPDTTYAYQLVNGEKASDIYTFTTGGAGAFSFAYVGDPQIGAGNILTDTAGWDKTLKIIEDNEKFDGVSFMLSAGDQVNTANSEEQYDGYLNHETLKSLPVATVIGNHDTKSGMANYSEHFNVANESSTQGVTDAGGDSYFVYNNTLFMVLNTNDLSAAEHKDFMKAAINATKDQDIRWKIVTFHHSIYTVASHAEDSGILQLRKAAAPLFDEMGIDVVLMGHDHVYCRTYIMDGLIPITDPEKYDNKELSSVTNPEGPLYVTANSGSGSKHYNIKSSVYPYSAVQNQEKEPNVSKVTVSDTQFTITTYRTKDMSVVDTFTINKTAQQAVEPAKLVINQVYGYGGKDETPIANSFVEIYNPNDEAVSLNGYTLTYGDEILTLDESKSIPANGSYLIVGAAANTSAEFQTYELPEADQPCGWTIDNKKYTIELKKGDTILDSVTAGGDATEVSKQKSLQRVDHADTDTDNDFRIVVWEKGKMTADESSLSQYAPHNSKGEYGRLLADKPEETVTINTVSDTGLVEYLSSYSTGNTNEEGGVAEIVKFNEENDCMYLVSGQTQTLDIVKVTADGSTELVKKVNIAALGTANGFSAGDITSVDVNTDCDLVAIAVQNANFTANGVIVTLDYEGNFLAKYEAGVQPDMLTFSPDGNLILSANEGEPRNGYGEGMTDPMGSVTVVNLKKDSAVTYTFESLDSSRETLIANGVLLKKDTAPRADLEPEFIAVSSDSKTAYVTLQENNAVAALDLTNGTWKYVKGLGFKDHSVEGNGLDLDNDGSIDIRSENVYGVYMPDGIALVTIGSQDYLITANEGDAREWGEGDNKYANIASATLTLSDGAEAGKKIEYLDTSKTDGLEPGKTYILGGRSFSIWNADTLEQVFDSGDDFEQITAREFPEHFNSGHDEAGLDKRSHKKGVEPESVSVLETNGKVYAIVGLERMGGIMVYDISEPDKAVYADYLNVRGFSETVKDLSKLGDLGPEGICTISAENSPTGNAMILVANEVSGTVTVAQIEKTAADKDDDDDDSGSSGSSSSGGGAVSVSYAIAVEDATDGTVITDRTRASYGSTVTLTVTPDTGYTLETLTVTDKNGKEIELTNKGDGKYTFKMPGCKVVVKATFMDSNTMLNFFVDVSAETYYCNAVLWAAENGITSGTTATTFSPDNLCTRAQMATFLWRTAGSPDPVGSTNPFVDVPADAYYAKAVQWAYEKGITGGTSATTFSPDQTCTRAQMATFLWHNAGSPETLNTTNPFADVPVNVYYATAVQWAYDNGITSGTNATAFSPNASCTRAQMVTFLYRCFAAK